MQVELHPHASERLSATQAEVIDTVLHGERFLAKFNRMGFRKIFAYNAVWRGRMMFWRPETGKNPVGSKPGSYRLRRLMRDVQAKMRDPAFLADRRRQARLMAQHPENDAIDDWLDAIRDPSDCLEARRYRAGRPSRPR